MRSSFAPIVIASLYILASPAQGITAVNVFAPEELTTIGAVSDPPALEECISDSAAPSAKTIASAPEQPLPSLSLEEGPGSMGDPLTADVRTSKEWQAAEAQVKNWLKAEASVDEQLAPERFLADEAEMQVIVSQSLAALSEFTGSIAPPSAEALAVGPDSAMASVDEPGATED